MSDLVLGPGADGKVIQPEGIVASALNASQQALLLDVVHEWVGILNDDALLHWNGPINLVIAGGNLRITLLDTTFSDSFNGVVTA